MTFCREEFEMGQRHVPLTPMLLVSDKEEWRLLALLRPYLNNNVWCATLVHAQCCDVTGSQLLFLLIRGVNP